MRILVKDRGGQVKKKIGMMLRIKVAKVGGGGKRGGGGRGEGRERWVSEGRNMKEKMNL